MTDGSKVKGKLNLELDLDGLRPQTIPMRVDLIPALKDNYIFAICENSQVLVVDPGSSAEVHTYLKSKNATLKTILVTHHHHDHIDGIAELQASTGAQVYGPETLLAKGIKSDRVIVDGDKIEFGSFNLEAMHLPGHTLDQISYFEPKHHVLFCGDTLFSLGCGRLFEGTAEQMFSSLQKIKLLPPQTTIYGAHEYTLQNLEFTLGYLAKLNASREEIAPYKRLHQMIAAVRVQNHPTIPSRLMFEMQHNLFLKVSTVEEFKVLREARNAY